MDEKDNSEQVAVSVLREPSTKELADLLAAGQSTSDYYTRDRERLERKMQMLSLLAKHGKAV